jgi:hypothetical protein
LSFILPYFKRIERERGRRLVSQLDKQLEKIQKGLAESSQLYKSSKQKLYENLADAYLWWRKAVRKKGYLEKLYANRKIGSQDRGLEPNFHQLVRLIFGMQQGEQAAQIANNAYAIQAIHLEYESKSFLYKNRENPVAELVVFITKRGGMRGLRKHLAATTDEQGSINAVTSAAVPTKQQAQKEKSAKLQNKLYTDAQTLIEKKKKARLTKTGDRIDIGEVATNDDELVVVLAKRNDLTNALTVLGTTADEDAVDRVLLEVGELDYSSTTQLLRVLAETLKPNIIPKRLQMKKVRNKFFATKKLKVTGADGAKATISIKEATRLVARNDGTILVSKTSSDVSLVTVAKPMKALSVEQDVFLRGSDRYWMETELLNEGQILLYSTGTTTRLEKADTAKVKAQYQLALHNSRSKQSRNIYFYDIANIDSEITFQPTVKNPESVSYDWNIEASASFVKRLHAKHFEKWLYGINKGVALKHNLHMELICLNDGLEIRSDWQDGKYGRHGSEFTVLYDKAATCTKHSNESAVVVSPLDCVQPFATITALALKSKVRIEGNKHLLHLSYETEAGAYDVYIPACDTNGIRDKTHFTLAYAND